MESCDLLDFNYQTGSYLLFLPNCLLESSALNFGSNDGNQLMVQLCLQNHQIDTVSEEQNEGDTCS
jgi:hypothetical protein